MFTIKTRETYATLTGLTWLVFLDDDRIIGRQRRNGAHSCPERQQHCTDNAGRQRNIEQRFPLRILYRDSPNVPLMNDLLHSVEQVLARNLVLFCRHQPSSGSLPWSLKVRNKSSSGFHSRRRKRFTQFERLM